MFLNKQNKNKQTKPLDQCPVFILNEGPYVSFFLPLSPVMFPLSAHLSTIHDNCSTPFLLLKPPAPPWLHPFPALDLVPYFTEKTETLQVELSYFPVAMRIHQTYLVPRLCLPSCHCQSLHLSTRVSPSYLLTHSSPAAFSFALFSIAFPPSMQIC